MELCIDGMISAFPEAALIIISSFRYLKETSRSRFCTCLARNRMDHSFRSQNLASASAWLETCSIIDSFLNKVVNEPMFPF